MRDSRPLAPAPRLLVILRSVWLAIALISLLRFAWLMAFPMAFYWVVDDVWSVAPIAFGFALETLGQLVAQRVRRSVRAQSLERSAQDALDKAVPVPEANVDSAFWTAHLTEFAVIEDVPSIVAASGALVGIAALSLARFGAGAVLAAGLLLLVGIFLTTSANRARRRVLDEVVTRRVATAEILSASERDAGEISGPVARQLYGTHLRVAADAWCRAQDSFERRRLLHIVLIGCVAAAALAGLASFQGFDIFRADSRQRTTLPSASELLLLGSALPIARVLVSHVDSLLVGYTSISKLELPRLRAQRTRRSLAAPPKQLVISGLRYHHGDTLVLDTGRCEIDLSEPLVVTGENGAGKTTLVSIIASVVEHTEGSVDLDGIDVREISRDDVAFVPQHPLAMLELSIAQNAALIAPAGPTSALRTLLDDLGLRQPLDWPMRALSRGEQQRVAIARALLKQPKLLILDEPDAWLDRRGRELLMAVLERESTKMAMVLVTHRVELSMFRGTTLELGERGAVISLAASQPGVSRSAGSSSA